MTTAQIITWAIMIIGSGLAGAILNQYVTARRDRVQPISYSPDVMMVKVDEGDVLRVGMTDPQGTERTIYRLYLAKIILTNCGNRDLEEFSFGLTLPPGLTAIDADVTPPDRHHVATKGKDSAMDKEPQPATFDEATEAVFRAWMKDPNEIRQELDFCLKPFNRGDVYVVNLAVVPMVIDGGLHRGDSNAVLVDEGVQLVTSAKGVRFVKASERSIWPWSRSQR
jgi:hypothetical protein